MQHLAFSVLQNTPFQLSKQQYNLGLSTFLNYLGLSDLPIEGKARPLLALHFFFAGDGKSSHSLSSFSLSLSIPSVSLHHVSPTTTVSPPHFLSLSSDVGLLASKRHWPGTFIVTNVCPLCFL